MTMLGDDFFFRCDSCNAESYSYSASPFPDLVRHTILLPAWSLKNRCWGQIMLDLTTEQRRAMPRKEIIEMARAISNPGLTIAVPMPINFDTGEIEVVPEPVCPKCESTCRAIVGRPTTPT